MLQISTQEILFALVVALLVFGPKRLPQIARRIGKTIQQLRKAGNQLMRDMDIESEDDDLPG